MTTKIKVKKEEKKVETKKESTLEKSKGKYFFGRGRRKEAAAQVRIFPNGKGKIVINNLGIDSYFLSEDLKQIIITPLEITGNLGKFDVTVICKGGGKKGQAEAIKLGISRALVTFSPELKTTLRKASFLTRDPREKERKKYGLKGARKAPQSPKR